MNREGWCQSNSPNARGPGYNVILLTMYLLTDVVKDSLWRACMAKYRFYQFLIYCKTTRDDALLFA